jgi:hypothetical protein
MKIKVGDWVKCKHEKGVARVLTVEGDMAELYIGGEQSYEYLEDLQKLPIKFKPFEIVLEQVAGQLKWDCYRNTKSNGKVHFVCIKDDEEYFIGYKIPHERFVLKYCSDIEDAQDWLNYSYATMIAKARGFV